MAIAITILSFTAMKVRIDENEGQKNDTNTNFSIHDLDSLFDSGGSFYSDNIFVLGDSLGDRRKAVEEEEKRKAEERKRETLARESRVKVQASPSYGSYSGAQVIGISEESCVIYAKRITGISRSLGYAGNTPTQGLEPQVGAIGLEKRYGHAVVIQSISGEKITITEANFVKGKITLRVLSRSELRGYIYN